MTPSTDLSGRRTAVEARAREEHDAAEPEQQAEHLSCADRLAVGHEGFDADHPERDHRDHDRRDTGRDELLRPHQASVSNADHQQTEKRVTAPRLSWRQHDAAHPQDQRDDNARNKVPRSSHRKGRDAVDGHPRRKVSGTPGHAHRDPRPVGVADLFGSRVDRVQREKGGFSGGLVDGGSGSRGAAVIGSLKPNST